MIRKFTRAQAYINPLQGHIAFDGKQYQGGFLVARDKGKTFLINNLDLEDYVLLCFACRNLARLAVGN